MHKIHVVDTETRRMKCGIHITKKRKYTIHEQEATCLACKAIIQKETK